MPKTSTKNRLSARLAITTPTGLALTSCQRGGQVDNGRDLSTSRFGVIGHLSVEAGAGADGLFLLKFLTVASSEISFLTGLICKKRQSFRLARERERREACKAKLFRGSVRAGRGRGRGGRPLYSPPPGICMQTPAAAKAAPHADAVLPVAPGRPESSVTATSVAAPPPPPSLPLYTCTYTSFVLKYKKLELDITFLI